MLIPGLQKNNTSLFFFLNSLEGIILIFVLILLPADPKNAVFAGYSVTRLALAAGMLAAAGFFWLLGLRERKTKLLSSKLVQISSQPTLYNAILLAALTIAFLAASTFLATGSVLARFSLYFGRLFPAVVWLVLILLQFAGLLLHTQKRSTQARSSAAAQPDPVPSRPVLRLAIFTFLVLMILSAFIFISGLGARPDQHYWNEPGVPLLWTQVAAALLAAFMVHRIGRLLGIFPAPAQHAANGSRDWRNFLPDAGIFLLLWLLASVLWLQTPQQPHPWAPGPYPPNEMYYPIIDALDYYIDAHFAVIGQHLSNGMLSDKPVYAILLFFLQMITKGDFSSLINWHVVVMALYPPMLYIIGKQLHSRKAGLFLALLAVLYEMNAIQATTLTAIPTAKLLMSEELARIGLLGLAILLVGAFKNRTMPAGYLIAAGAVLGWNTMIRYNTWLLLPVLMVVIYFSSRVGLTKRIRLVVVAFFLAGCLFGLSGWMAREELLHSNALFFLSRFTSTIWSGRYSPVPDAGMETAEVPAAPTPARQEVVEPALAAEPGSVRRNLSLPAAFVNHFLHNVVSSAVSLPVSMKIDSVENTMIQSPLYAYEWSGDIQPGEAVLSIINLALVSVGIAIAWKRHGWAGILPLILFTGYYAGNAVALTSGNRYVTPVLWCLLFYYATGLLTVTGRLAKQILVTVREPEPGQAAGVQESSSSSLAALKPASVFIPLAAVLLVSWGFAFVDRLIPIPQKFANIPEQEIAYQLIDGGELSGLGIPPRQIDAFLQEPAAQVMRGEVLFPRFYLAGQGEMRYDNISSRFFIPQLYPRLIFHLIGAHGSPGVILPVRQSPETFPHLADAVVIGCQREGYVEALIVVLNGVDENGLARDSIFTKDAQPAVLTCAE